MTRSRKLLILVLVACLLALGFSYLTRPSDVDTVAWLSEVCREFGGAAIATLMVVLYHRAGGNG